MAERHWQDVFQRWERNPVLALSDIPFRCNTVFNGTSVKLGEQYLLLLRVEGQQGYSFFALATSTDGFHFEVEREPVLFPAKEGLFELYESDGIEDPRATLIDGVHHIMYTAASGFGPRIALATTVDFRSFERIALVSEPGNKDGVLFPERIDGLYVRLDRPIGQDVGRIWISYSKDLRNWGHSRVLMSPRYGYWDSYRIGASVPPIRTEQGWLEIYHGNDKRVDDPGIGSYAAGALLLDLNNPQRLLRQSAGPILAPETDFERQGFVPNVVFPTGLVERDETVLLYYGAADTNTAVVEFSRSELLAALH